ncbi:hypothetical protein Zmor_005131 [Zophobas morio]|uniref:Tyrosinase copper-binding domain-containing protein n=1 Tax=Zophobas morio TaxID=2755281 RepID=A0AA38ISV8_9CUCU|nr:hypothetical protein Zmor_005131 [Zophobas morio]
MPLSNYQKAIGYISGVLGTLQAIIWFILSLLCLIYYYKDITITSRSLSILEAIYVKFLDPNFFYWHYSSDDVIIEPAAFAAYNWVYIFIDVLWFAVSVNQIIDFSTNSKGLYKSIRSFIAATVIVSVLDVIFVVSLGIDYNETCVNSEWELNTELCDKALIPVLIISAKVFVLWVLNVIFVYMLRHIATKLQMEILEVGLQTWTVTPVTIYSPEPPPPPVNTLIVEETIVVMAVQASVDSPTSDTLDGRYRY